MEKITLKEIDVKNQRVLMRVDFNVPLKNGMIEDDSRIRASIPSIQYVLDQGGSLVLMSHLGRPKGEADPEASLAPVAKRLSELLKRPVQMSKDCVGSETQKQAAALQPGQILLLENLRFHPGEKDPSKEPNFTKELASFGQVYVNDAFGSAHRKHASTALIAEYFPKASAMGFLMEKEVRELQPLLENPPTPFYAIIGGAKVSSKIGVLEKLLTLVDSLFIGGAMVFTFLKEQGIEIGASITEDTTIIQNLPKNKLILPSDLIIADQFSNEANIKTIPIEKGIPKGWYGMDIGPKTVKAWSEKLLGAKTVFWNGPLGAYEMPNFNKGTHAIASTLANSSAKTYVGGGNSVAAIEQMGLSNKFTHLSTGGGASLEFLEQGHLPGIDSLTDK